MDSPHHDLYVLVLVSGFQVLGNLREASAMESAHMAAELKIAPELGGPQVPIEVEIKSAKSWAE